MSNRDTNRLKIKQTVEQAIPMADIDVTKVLSDEECAELHRQMAQRKAALKTAKDEGRSGLRARFKRSMMKFVSLDEDAPDLIPDAIPDPAPE